MKVIEDNINLDGKFLTELPKLQDVRVYGHFDCHHNLLTSLEGAPMEVDGNFNCRNNKITSLKHAPKKVGIAFIASNNPLISLEGCPKDARSFSFYNCGLTDLNGAPETVKGNFICAFNKLTSLKGGPTRVDFDFNCSGNKLLSLEGCPEYVGGNFECYDNDGIEFTEEQIRAVCDVGGRVL